MKKTQHGSIHTSKITLGTVQLGMPYGINNTSGMPTLKESLDILRTAEEGGILMLDTSNDYGESEAVIGEYIRQNPTTPLSVCTKFRVDSVPSGGVYNELRKCAEASLKKLNLSSLPVFMSHVETDYFTHTDELADALARLKKEGLILHTGMSMSQKGRISEIIDSGIFDSVQLPMNVLDAEEIRNGTVRRMHDAGITVFVRSVYLQGLLFKDPASLVGTKFDSAVAPLTTLHAIADKSGRSIADLALAFIRDSYGVDSLVLGCENIDQLKSNLALVGSPTLSPEIYCSLLDAFKDIDPFLIHPWEWATRN